MAKNDKVSKFLSLVLRHQPESIGLELDEEGWADVSELLRQLGKHGKAVGIDQLREVVATNEKKRFAFDESGTRIRASQGHSIKVDLKLEPATPPDVLWHGTATRFLKSILKEGLTSQSRQHVHLSGDQATAAKVGARHGKLVILSVDARTMTEAGHHFYQSANGVWLTDVVPPQYLAGAS